MNQIKTQELSLKVLLGEEEFLKFKKSNRFWFLLVTLAQILVVVLLVVPIKSEELDSGLFIGIASIIYCVVFGVLASKSKKSAFLWVVLAFVSSFVAFIPAYLLMLRVGFKQEWL